MRLSKISRLVAVLGVALASICSALPAGATATPGNCQPFNLNVALAQGQPADQHISGTLCTPLTWQGGHNIDVMVHGATYNSTYWNWPTDGGFYSYVNKTLLAGRATLAYDSLGAGNSSHPNSSLVTNAANAYALHQIISWTHAQHYQKVHILAHSLGSVVTIAETAQYNDATSIALTGIAHGYSTQGAALLGNGFYPANQDPLFQGKGLDDGYLTTKTGMRGSLFYSAIAAQDVINYDEAHKDLVSSTVFSDPQITVPPATNITQKITVPVLLVLGQQDNIFCGAGAPSDCSSKTSVQNFEGQYYAHAASFTVQLVANTGHDLNLHPTIGSMFANMNSWLCAH